MKTTGRFSAAFKVALEAIRGERTISELTTEHQRHPNQITPRKQQVDENLAKAFDDKLRMHRLGGRGDEAHARWGGTCVVTAGAPAASGPGG